MIGDTRNQVALMRICDYGFQIDDPQDRIGVMEIGRVPDSWRHKTLNWQDLAIESLDTRLRIALNEPATNRTPHGLEARRSVSLGFLTQDPIRLNDYLSFCDARGGTDPVRFSLFQFAAGPYDSAGGRLEVLWVDVNDCDGIAS